jgi:DNA-binding LacI/PurR family transcriptional regulator
VTEVPERVQRPPTLYDVAARAQVSHMTVSRFVQGSGTIHPDRRARIERAIEDLGYRPNLTARSLATNRSHRMGALVYEMAELGPMRILDGATERAREAGYLLDIVSPDPSDRAIQEAATLLSQSGVAGVLVFAPTDSLLHALSRVQFSVPLIVESEAIGSTPAGPTFNEVGVRLAADHLLALGHRSFFHITGPEGWLATRGRALGLESGLATRGLDLQGSAVGDWTADSGYRAGLIVPVEAGVTAVVIDNDQMALGALAAFAQRGLRVPEDVSVVGFDDIPEARYFGPGLTTVRLDFGQQGRLMVERLLVLMEQEADPPGEELQPELVVRGSTAVPRA